jgi:hypothetical protein
MLVPVLGVLTSAAVYASWRHRRRRLSVRQGLAEQRGRLVEEHAALVQTLPDATPVATEFGKQFLAHCRAFLPAASLERLRQESLAAESHAERYSIPLHKKGATLSYEALHRFAPACLSFFHAPKVRQWISAVVGEEVWPTADHDQSSCSVLYYNEAGDHINWHYDHNFYKGRHFTVLLSLINRGGAETPGLSAAQLMWKDRQGELHPVDTAENGLVVFEGARVLHRVSPTVAGDRRVILSMTYCTDPRVGRLAEVVRRLKDTAYFGVRALWD